MWASPPEVCVASSNGKAHGTRCVWLGTEEHGAPRPGVASPASFCISLQPSVPLLTTWLASSVRTQSHGWWRGSFSGRRALLWILENLVVSHPEASALTKSRRGHGRAGRLGLWGPGGWDWKGCGLSPAPAGAYRAGGGRKDSTRGPVDTWPWASDPRATSRHACVT